MPKAVLQKKGVTRQQRYYPHELSKIGTVRTSLDQYLYRRKRKTTCLPKAYEQENPEFTNSTHWGKKEN